VKGCITSCGKHK